jgi:hypothetical protein
MFILLKALNTCDLEVQKHNGLFKRFRDFHFFLIEGNPM